MCSFKLLHMSDIISLMICWSNNLTLSSVVNKNETYNFTHFKQSYSYQSICLQLVSKWIIFVIAISIVICATMVKMICNHVFNYKMVLSCKWDYDLWLLLVWTKMKLKIVFMISKCGSYVIKQHVVFCSTWIMTIHHSCKCTCVMAN
jgi:hypothetical protein